MTYTQSQLDEAVRAAVEAERAACEMAVDKVLNRYHSSHQVAERAALRSARAAIRARGETK